MHQRAERHKAAAYQRLGLTMFIMRIALPAAKEVVARHERLRLGARDSARVLGLLDHPPKPTAALRAAARRLRRTGSNAARCGLA